MDKMCNKLGAEDLNKSTNSGETENLNNRSSPVFKCFNNTKAIRGSHLDSSDYDIPSYQVNQSIKSRTSSKYGNDTSESVLPFTPIFSPIPVASSVQFQPPSIHSLSTVAKNIDKSCENKIRVSSNCSRVERVKPCGIFESLGMTDKDISWVSSMATPPPKNVPGSEFNTVEKATFFPEEKFQNIQPRALFSPTLDDDFGCHPIIFTSESEDDEYKSNIRLSDVCATLKQLEVKSLDLVQNNSLDKTINDKDFIISPIIKMKKKKLGSAKKKKKGSLVISPESNDKYEFTVGENLKSLECEKVNSGNNFIEDDSFQSMSFSGIDELCKTLVNEQNSSVPLKTEDCDKTLITAEDSISKKFYFSKTASHVYKISSMHGLHSYAKALEEGDKYISRSCKTNQPFPKTGILRFDILNKDQSKADGNKRSCSEIIEGNDEGRERKLKKVEEENSGWESMKQYLSESQLNVSDGEIFRTVENLEKTLASQESKDSEKLHDEKLQGVENNLLQNSFLLSTATEIRKCKESIIMEAPEYSPKIPETCTVKNNDAKNPDDCPRKVPLVAFTTASGSKISVSEKALNKAREILKECNENLELEEKQFIGSSVSDKQNEKPGEEDVCHAEILMNGFSSASGKQIKVSTEALQKARALMSECEVPSSVSEKCVDHMNIQCQEKVLGKPENLINVIVSGSGKQIQVSDDALEEGQTKMSEFNDAAKEYFPGFKNSVEGFQTGFGKKIQVSSKALEKAKTLMAKCDKDKKDPWLKSSKFNSKKSKTFKCDKSSEENLSRLKTNLMDECSSSSAKPIQSGTLNCGTKSEENLSMFKGFCTSSGKTIQVSTEALEKAKSLLRNCEQECAQSLEKFASEWIGELDKNALTGGVEECPKGTTSDDKNEKPEICFSTASGKSVKVSKNALEKAKELWSNNVENATEVPGSSALPQIDPAVMGFATVEGSEVPILEAELEKSEERINDWDQIKVLDSRKDFCVTDCPKISVTNISEIPEKNKKSEVNVSRMSTTSGMDDSDDWNEIIPSWLHVYNTSPSIASERSDLSPLICHEDGTSSKHDREYIIKSPVLGAGDRFHGKIKRRKLRFQDETNTRSKAGWELRKSGCPSFKNSERKTGGKRTSTLTLDFSVPFKKMRFGENEIVSGLDLKRERARARENQEEIIKQNQKVKPLRGSHLSRKLSEKQMSWREAVGGSSPEMYSDEVLRSFGVCEDVLKINFKDVISYRFKGQDFFGSSCASNIKGFPVGDECLLILDDDNKFGIEELKRALLACPGVQPNLVPHGWVENHSQWIIWKLANYERCFPQFFGGKCLTPNQIMLQLKYRYDREIDMNERSALKKILERDDTSIKRLVLYVCDIQKVMAGESMGYKLTLTDGWYSCPALSDPAMTRLIEKGKLSIGTKLVTQGATLVNCEQGVSPLEMNEDVYLKISTNSTRRIRWDAKLGFQKDPENFPISLGSILPQGGQISRIDVIIVRIYPTLYMEKTSDGRHVTRNRRSEEKADSEYRRIQEQRMESICKEIQSEVIESTNSYRELHRNCLSNLEQVEDLGQFAESSLDPSALKELMLTDQRKFLENDRFSRELREKIKIKMEKEKMNKRNVSEFLRVKIVDFRKPDFNNPALLSVWNLNEDLMGLITEGKVISVMNVTISNSSRTFKPLQINTTRQTQYRQVVRSVKYPARKLTRLKDVSSRVCPAFEEVDIVGVVALIRDVSYGSRLTQVIYLTDLEMNFVGVVFWGSCKDYGWENVLKIPSIVACSNLQWKKNYTAQDVPSLYVSENSVFTENPKHVYLKEEIERLKQSLPKDKTAFLSKCEDELTTKLEDSKWQKYTRENSSASSNLRETAKPSASNGFESRPTASSTPIKPFSVRMDSGEAEPSPIQKRIEKLQCYGEPPSLIPLLVRNNVKRKIKRK